MSSASEVMEHRLDDVLTTEIPTEQPEELYKFAVKAEALTYYVVKKQAESERELAAAEKILNEKRAELKELHGTVAEKQAQWDAKYAFEVSQAEMFKADIRYWKNVGDLLEKKISLVQSILSNITASIKSGMYLDNASRA